MFIKVFICGPIDNNVIFVGCEKTKKAAIIDPAICSFSVVKKFLDSSEYILEKILITHSHWDHIAEIYHFQKEYSAKVYVHKLDAPFIENPENNFFSSHEIKQVKADVYLENNDTVKVGDIEFLVIHTPGHTPGGACFYSKENNILFSGDTLFKGTFGRVDFPYADSEKMLSSLKRLIELPLETRVIPGHGDETTIKDELWIKNIKNIRS